MSPLNGEITFDAGGRSYRLVLGFNALCAAEVQTGKRWSDIMADAQSGSPSVIRVLFWAGLRKHHPEVTVDGAGDLIDAVGMGRAGELVATAVTSAFPPTEGAGPLAASRKAGKRS
jgi:hypothetical protein